MLKYPFIFMYSLVCTHYRTLVNQFDLVHLEPDGPSMGRGPDSANASKIRLNFAFQVGLSILAISIGTFGLYYETYARLASLGTVLSSPVIVMHQIIPPQLGNQVDPMIWSAFFTVLCIALSSLVQPMMESRFRMTLVQSGSENVLQIEGSELSQIDSKKILKIHQNGKRIVNLALLWVYAIILSYYYAMVLINSVYQISIWSAPFWIMIFPTFTFYITFEMFGKIIFVLLTSVYILVRQKSILAQLTFVRQLLEATPPNQMFPACFSLVWRRFLHLNSRVALVCRHLRVYGKVWSPFLSLTFANYIIYQCYVAYALIFIHNVPLFMKMTFAFCLINVQVMLLFTTRQCAKVVKCNQKITHENQRLYRGFQNQTFGTASDLFKARVLLKAESLQVGRLLHCYAFTMFGNYRITSKTFHVIISYVCVFFLTVVKDRYVIYK